MTKIAISPNVNGTGTFTIAAPDSNTDRTLTLPDAAGEVLTNASNIEAQVKTAANASGSAPIYAARAWVNFNGTGTVAIRASGNVSSITDVAVGNYSVNFTTAMPTADYVVCFTGEHNFGVTFGFSGFVSSSSTANGAQLLSINANGSAFDNSHIRVAIFC